jgi:cell wall-associated NlpC family hydrolase
MPAPLVIARAARSVLTRPELAGDTDDDGSDPGRGRGSSTKVTLAVLALPLLGFFAVPVLVMALLVNGGGASPGGVGGGYGTGLKPGTVPAAYATLVEQAGAMCAEAPPSIIAAQIETESNWNPNAVSSAGAQGIAQFLPSTWPSWSKPGQSPFDPAAAIPAMGRYDCALAAQMRQAQPDGEVPAAIDVTSLMLACYNAGAGAVLAAHGIPDNGQTPDYVAKITARAAHYANTTGTLPGTGAPPGSFAAREIAFATAQIGIPYAFAGGNYTGPTYGVCTNDEGWNDCHIIGFDCSGLVMFAAYQASNGRLRLDHFADTQTRGGTPVPRNQMRAGDLIGFTNPGESVAHHVGIYLGGNQMVDAPESGTTVRIDSLTSAYYQAQQWRVVRYG